MPLSDTTRRELILKAKLLLYGIPVGKNFYNDTPIVGNKSLAQIVLNRIDSIAKNAEQFKYLTDVFIQLLKETKGQTVSRIKLDKTNEVLVKRGLTDQHGNIIKKSL